MASALINSRPSFNLVSRMAPTLPGRRDQEDPDIPGDMTDDQRSEALVFRIQRSPVEACGRGGAGPCEVGGLEMDAPIDRRGDQRAPNPAVASHQASLDPAPPEHLLSRATDKPRPPA